MAGKRITKSVESLKEVVGLVDSLGTSVDFLEERLRGVFVQLSNMGQLPPINFNKTTQGSQSAAPQFTAASTPSAPMPQTLSNLGIAPHEPSQTRYNHVSPNFSFPPSVVHPNASMSSVFGPEISPAMRDVRSREGERKQNAVAAPDPDQNLGSPFAKNKTEDLRRTFGTLNDTLIGTNNTLSRLATSLEDFTKGQKSKGSDPVKEQAIAEERKPRQNSPKEENPYRDDGKEFSIFDKKAIFGALGAVSAAVSTYFKTEVATRSIGVGSQRIGEMARFGIAGSMQERALDSAMATDAGSMLRYQGDILLPGQTKYLGRGGFNNALEVSGRETNDRLELEKAKHSGSVSSSFTTGVVATGLGLVGGAALGMSAVPALALAAFAGVGTLASGLLGASNDTYSQLTDGGLASSFIGPLIYGGKDNAKRVAADNRSKVRSQFEQETYENTLALQESELKSNKRNEAAYGTYLQSVKSRMANTTMIGGYSMGAYSNISPKVMENYEEAINKVEDMKMDISNGTSPLAPGYNGEFYNLNADENLKVTDAFGWRTHPITGVREKHKGTDRAPKDKNNPVLPRVRSGVTGEVIMAGPDNHLGFAVRILDKRGGIFTSGHLEEGSLPKKGDQILAGEFIGRIAKRVPGDPNSTAPHNHTSYKDKLLGYIDFDTLTATNSVDQVVSSKKIGAEKALSPVSTFTVSEINKNYNIDMEQLYNYRARLLNVMEPYDVKRDKQGNIIGENAQNITKTTGLLDLQQAGLGSFDTLIGNLGGLNQARGTNDNTGALREIMTSAVAAGFDRSRSAQQFVESVTDLSGRLGVTDTESLSKSLSFSSKLLSADSNSGRADEKGLSNAKNAMESLASATSESDGLMGAVKAAVLTRQGVRLNSGAQIYATMSSAQMSSTINTLDKHKNLKNISDIKNYEIEALLQVADGNTAEEKRASVLETLKKMRSAVNNVQNSAARSIGDKSMSYDDLRQNMIGKTDKQKEEMLRAEMQKHGVAIEATGKMTAKAAALQYYEDFSDGKALFKLSNSSLKQIEILGRTAATTAANAASSGGADAAGRTGAVMAEASSSLDDLRKSVGSGTTIKTKTLTIRSTDDFDKAVRDSKGKAELEEYSKKSRLEIAAEAKASSGFNRDSTVKIDNTSIQSLATAIVDALKGKPSGKGEATLQKK